MFSILGLQPTVGRLLNADDDRPGCIPRAVLSHAFWQRAYGGSPSVVGQTLTLSAHAVEIIGVAPDGFFGMRSANRSMSRFPPAPIPCSATTARAASGRAQTGGCRSTAD